MKLSVDIDDVREHWDSVVQFNEANRMQETTATSSGSFVHSLQVGLAHFMCSLSK